MNVYILLDRSGSMETMWKEAINSINAYVNTLTKKDHVHFAVFDSVSYDVMRDVKVKDWEDVGITEVTPRGGTPLYDSCGKIMSTAEEKGSNKTMLVVMTDGYENASKEYSQLAIKEKVKNWENKKWEVVFLGANFDAVDAVSGSVGVVSSKSMNISAGNFLRSMETLSSYTNAYATTGQSINFSDDDKLKAAS